MPEGTRILAPDTPVEETLGKDEIHVYELPVDPRSFIRLVAEQHGRDVLARLFGPDGEPLVEVDSPTGGDGTEEVIEVADAGGTYRLEIHPVDSGASGAPGTPGEKPGSYRLRIAELRPATAADVRRVAAQRAFHAAEGSRRQGLVDAALAAYREQVLPLWQELGDAAGEGLVWYRIGWMEHLLGSVDRAEEAYGRACSLLGQDGDTALLGTVWNRRGRAFVRGGNAGRARQAHQRAVDIFHALNDAAGEAAALNNLGNACAEMRDVEGARSAYAAALALWERLGDVEEAARTRTNVEQLQGDAALATDATGARGVEPGNDGSPGAEPGDDGSPAAERAATLAAQGAANFAAGDLAGAAECFAKIFAGSLDAETVVLGYVLGDEGSLLWTKTTQGHDSHALPGRALIEAAARRFIDLARRDDAAAVEPRRYVGAALSRLLLAPAAAQLGRRRLVVVPAGGLELVPFALLPEPAATASEVADGADATETPDASPAEPAPLIAGHEIVMLPAVTALGAMRRRAARREPALQGMALVADPIYDVDDARLNLDDTPTGSPRRVRPLPSLAPLPPAIERCLREVGLLPLRRLARAEAEAAAVAEAMPPTSRILGGDANVERITGGLLRDHRLLHFAVAAPATSDGAGLVLSLRDEDGCPRHGFLTLGELARLDLAATLMVVTGGRVAWGAEGGGLGLVRAAMQAGAARVVTTLWAVGDDSGVELVRGFYRRLLVDGLPPAAALRGAQLAVASEPRWASPSHWAGFVFCGDWSLERPDDAAAATGPDGGGPIEASDKGGTGTVTRPDPDFTVPGGAGEEVA
jgi:tetratricopeptide (TPR) repeat protein